MTRRRRKKNPFTRKFNRIMQKKLVLLFSKFCKFFLHYCNILRTARYSRLKLYIINTYYKCNHCSYCKKHYISRTHVKGFLSVSAHLTACTFHTFWFFVLSLWFVSRFCHNISIYIWLIIRRIIITSASSIC